MTIMRPNAFREGSSSEALAQPSSLSAAPEEPLKVSQSKGCLAPCAREQKAHRSKRTEASWASLSNNMFLMPYFCTGAFPPFLCTHKTPSTLPPPPPPAQLGHSPDMFSWKMTFVPFRKFLPIRKTSSPPSTEQLCRLFFRISGMPAG